MRLVGDRPHHGRNIVFSPYTDWSPPGIQYAAYRGRVYRRTEAPGHAVTYDVVRTADVRGWGYYGPVGHGPTGEVPWQRIDVTEISRPIYYVARILVREVTARTSPTPPAATAASPAGSAPERAPGARRGSPPTHPGSRPPGRRGGR